MKHKPPVQKREGIQQLGDTPAFQEIKRSWAEKARMEPERAMPQPEMQPVPQGFRELAYYPDAGVRVTQSKDQSTTGIQFDENYRAIRGGLNSEVEQLADERFSFNFGTRQWERYAPNEPEANRVGAKRFGQQLADRRGGVQR